MSESGQASVGQILRNAREAQGVTVEDAAVRLRLMQRQIEAMETDDFESLGQPVFARGFVRNYARLLGLAPEALLARMEGAPAEPAAVSQTEPPQQQRSWLSSPWLIVLLLGLLLVVAIPVVLYLWLNSEVDEGPVSQAPAAQSRPAQQTPPVPAAALPAEAPPVTAAAAVAQDVPTTEVAAPAEAESPAAVAPAVASSVLHLEFGAEAWTEIKDSSGRMLHRQLNPAGSSVEIHGQPPFDLVIGNAAQARMTYNGRPIDLKPFIDVTVARFTLEE
jgi:cytoskeleton protein RodZ